MKRCISALFALALVVACEPTSETGAENLNFPQAAESDLESIRPGFDSGVTISSERSWTAPHQRAGARYVAAFVTGPGIDDVGLWYVGSAAGGPIYSANGIADEFSDYPFNANTREIASFQDPRARDLIRFAESR